MKQSNETYNRIRSIAAFGLCFIPAFHNCWTRKGRFAVGIDFTDSVESHDTSITTLSK